MHWLRCHCLVALYIPNNRFKAWMMARTKRVTPRIVRGSAEYTSIRDGALLYVALQTEILITWTTVTRGMGARDTDEGPLK